MNEDREVRTAHWFGPRLPSDHSREAAKNEISLRVPFSTANQLHRTGSSHETRTHSAQELPCCRDLLLAELSSVE